MLNSIVQPLIQFLHHHPHSSGAIAFGVVFAEAMAVIGVIVPGSITMTAIGILIGSGVIPAGNTFMWAIIGAITGDYLSYVLGFYYKDKLHGIWPFSKHPQLLVHSEKFFREHGGKSVLIGRFVGPMRAMIPMVAGMFKMPFGKFLLAAVPSASIWAVSYMIPGVLLGALSLELPPKVATQFTVGVLLTICGIWLVVWLLQHFFKTIYRQLDRYMVQVWQFSQKYTWVRNFLADPHDTHVQLTLVSIVIVTVVLFYGLLSSIQAHGYVTMFDKPIYHLLCSIRNRSLDDLMVVLTILGETKVILSAAGVFLLWLVKKHYWYLALHWSALCLFTVGLIGYLKPLVQRLRPDSANLASFSFPSGHTLLSITILGFLAVIIAQALPKKQRKIPYLVVGVITGLIAWSRLYLGVHWLTDVIGSMLLGVSILLLLTISYRRKPSVEFSVASFTSCALTIFIGIWLIYSVVYFRSELQSFVLKRDYYKVDMATWRQQSFPVPLYRLNRLGNPHQVFNVQWLGELPKIKQYLIARGWQEQPSKLDLRGVIRKLSHVTMDAHFTLLPQLFHNRSPVFLATKVLPKSNVVVILYLWCSDIRVTDTKIPLWLGTVEYHSGLDPQTKRKVSFVEATSVLNNYLDNEFMWDFKMYPVTVQPPEMWGLPWDGKVLLIYPEGYHAK